jgi:hypothetical protein
MTEPAKKPPLRLQREQVKALRELHHAFCTDLPNPARTMSSAVPTWSRCRRNVPRSTPPETEKEFCHEEAKKGGRAEAAESSEGSESPSRLEVGGTGKRPGSPAKPAFCRS